MIKQREWNRMTYRERFESHFINGEDDECWEWKSGNIGGEYPYGILRNEDMRMELAHRQSYKLYIGDIPDGLCVLHRCDNPKCVNPRHLFIGTRKDNTHDMISKGRGCYTGSDHPSSKLSHNDVHRMRFMKLNGGYTTGEIAKKFGMTTGGILKRIRTMKERGEW